MDNIHLKNLNSEKILKELSKNSKAYLSYIFKQNINGKYIALYQFKKLPIIEEFDNEIIKIIYEITKEKITTIDKIINLITFEYNHKFKYSYYKRDQITNDKIAEFLLYYLIEHYLLHSLYRSTEVKKINTTLNKKYNELTIVQLGAADHNSISGVVKTLELLNKENNENNIEGLQLEFKNIIAKIFNDHNMLNIIRNYIYHHIEDKVLKPFKFTLYYDDLYIYDKIKDIIKETIIALKKLQVLEFDDKILK